MNKEALAELSRQLAPIAPPPAPDWTGVICIGGSLLTIVLIWVLMRWLQRKARHYQGGDTANIHQLQQAWQAGEYDSRRCAYELATRLRQHFGLTKLDTEPPAPIKAEREQWQQTVQLLDQLRYHGHGPQQLEATTFEQIQTWLARPC